MAFVLFLTLLKEGVDDLQRYARDKELNNKKYLYFQNSLFTISIISKLTNQKTFKEQASQSIKVGDVIKIHHNERIPADLVLLYTTEKSGTVFIRTDQLDGETDWKLRRAITVT